MGTALTLARSWGTPAALGEVLRIQARMGDRSDRIELLRQAVEQLERSPARLLHARALIDLGGAVRRSGHRSESRALLRAGYELAKQCDAAGLANTARQELAEIAQGLFVTVKTVEAHLTHAYQKLDIIRRAELGRALGLPA